MKSLKDEFRRDTGRVEAGDKPRYFSCVSWFMEYQRLRSGDVGNCVVAMDVFSFNLAGQAADSYIQEKKAGPLTSAVRVMEEQVRHLFLLVSGGDDALRTVGLGLMQRVYWDAEPRDRCLKVAQVWRPGAFTRKHLESVMGLVHGTVKVLDYCRRRYLPEVPSFYDESGGRRRPKLTNTQKLKLAAANYSVDWYVGRLLSSGAIKMYACALRNFLTNSEEVNHYIATFMTRVCKLKINAKRVDFSKEGEEPESDAGEEVRRWGRWGRMPGEP